MQLTPKLTSLISRPFVHGALAYATASLLALLTMLVGSSLPLPSWPVLSGLGPLLIVLAAGPVNVVLAYVLYPIVENQICGIPLMIGGWLTSAALSGKLVSNCVRGHGRTGYAIAVAIAALLLLPFVAFLAFMISIG